jgi:Domain of unknown function (DUF4340)
MMTKMNKGLVGLFAVQVVLAVIVLSSRGSDTVTYKQELVLPGFEAGTVTRLQIFADSGTKPAIDLVQSGAKWTLASHFNYPAETAKVTAALAPLSKMTAGEPVATSATRHKQLKVADGTFERKLVITAAGKDTVIYLGATAGLRRIAVRRAGEEIVLGATGVNAAIATAPREWVSRQYSEIPRDDIDKILVQRGTTSTELDRSVQATAGSGSGSGSAAGSGSGAGSGAAAPSWRLAFDGTPLVLASGEKIDDFAINTIMSEVASIEAQPADPAKDVSKPTATITVTRKNGTAVAFDIVADGDNLFVKQRGSDRATAIDKLRMELTLKLDRAALVRKPEAAGAGSGSGAPVMPPIVPRPTVPPKRP